MMEKSIRGSTCLGHLEKFKNLLPCKEVLEGANNTLKPANILLVIDGLDMNQGHLKSTQSYVDHCILKPWNDRQDMFITCIPTSESDTVNGLDVLSVLSALSYDVDDMACLEEIADQYRDHAGIGYLMSNLGVMFSEKMEYQKSEACFASAKNCFEREHDHLGNAVACLNLAILHKLMGNEKSARSLCDSAASMCHDIFMRMTGDVHLPWKVLRRVADLFQEFGNYKRYQDILKIGVLYDISGADEAPTITLMKRLMALQLKEQNGEKIQGEELEDVASQFLEFLDRSCTDIGVIKQELLNADLITTASILAKMYRDINRIEEACVLLEKLQAKYLLAHGKTHCLYASLLYHVGRFKLGVGKAGEAETMLKQALEMFVYYFGKGHHKVASCKSLLGTCALLKGHYRDASIVLTEALTLFKKINPHHPDVAEILLKFAFLFNEEGNFPSAKKTMQEALDIFNSACGEDSPKTASAYIEAAAFLQKVRESRASAADKAKKAIDIFLKLGLQHDHPDIMICRSLLGVLQLNMGSDEAEEQFTEVLQQVSLPEESFVASKIISPESTNMVFQVKTSSGADGYSCFGATVVPLVNLVSMKAGKEKRAHLNTLLGFLHGHETEMPLFAVFAGQNYIFHKVWLSDRCVYCILTDQGVNSDFTSLKSDGLEDPNVFLLSSTSYGKKPCYLLVWKTPEVLEMRELSRVSSAFRESVKMLFLQPKFRKGYIDGQDFYIELALPTEPCAVTSLYSQIDYLPLLVEQELSVSHKDGNIDTALHSSAISVVKPLTHVSYFLYTFSSQRQAEFVFDNLMCSLGQSLALAKAEGVEICNASAVQNGECFFILEPSNSSLSLVVEEESVLLKCRTVKEFESSCICASVKSTLESTLDSMCSVVRVTFKQSLQLFCDDHDVGCNCVRESAKKPHCLGHSLETLKLHGDVRSQELECDHLEGEPSADLLQNEVEEDIFTGQPGGKISTEVCLDLLECLLTSRHLSSEVQPSTTGEMSSSTYSAYLNDEKQLDNSMLSPGSMSSLNSYPTSPSNEVCQMPVFLRNMSVSEPCGEKKDPNNDDSCMIRNTSVACSVCSELPLTLQENLSNQFVGDNCARDSSAIISSHEEDVSSGENDQDTDTREIVQLEDGTQLTKEDILILKIEVEFCQNQCHELRQQLGQLKVQFQQCEEEKQQLEFELGSRSFLEDKQKRYEKAFLSSRPHANQQIKSCSASGASYDFTGTEGKLLGGAGPLQEPGFSLQQRLLEISNSLSDVELRQMKFLAKPRVDAFRLAKIREGFELFEELDANGVLSCTYVRELLEGIQRVDLVEKLNALLLGDAERGSHPPTGQTTSGRTTESSTIPPRENSLDLLPENPSQNSSGDNLQSNYEEGLATAEGDPVTELRETDTQCMPQLCHPTDGEFRDGVDSLHQNNIRKSDSERKRTFLSAKNNDDVVRLITAAAERDSQEQIEWLQRELQEYEAENQILQAELKRTSLPCAEKDLPGGACSLPGTRTGSRPATGQKMLDRITESPVIPLKDRDLDLLPSRQQVGCDETLYGMHIQGNGGVSGINEAGPVPPNMSCRKSVNSANDMAVLPMNSDSEDSSVHPHFADSSNGVSFSNESSSTTVSSSESSVSSAAESMRVESTSSSCMTHSVCDSSPRVTSDQLSAVKSREHFSDTSSYNPSSGEEEILESTVSNECESGDMDRRGDYAAKNEEIGQVSKSFGDVIDGPGKPPRLEMKGAACVAKDVVDYGPLCSPDRVKERAKPQHVPGLVQDVLPDGDISVEHNASGASSGTEKDTTVEQLVSDVSTQSKRYERLGARPRNRPPVKMSPPPNPSLIDLVPHEVTVASGLANAFLARHSQDQSLHESLCQVKLLSEETSLQGASYMDGTKHSGEAHKAKPYLGDCQVVPRPDVDSRWMLPPPAPGGEYDGYNAVGGYAYNTRLNTQLSGHVGPLPSYWTSSASNFPSSSAFNSSNYNLLSDFVLGAREPYLPLYGQVDSGLNTSVPGNQCLHSGMTGSDLANGSLMEATGPQLTPPVHGLQRYSGPSDNASRMASEREKANLAWKANSRQTSVGNMAHADVGRSGLPAPSIARSNGADSRHVSEAESRRTRQYEQGTGRSNVLNTSGDRVVSGANRDVDNTHTEAALLSAGSRDTRLVASGNEHLNLEPVGAEASFISANTGGSMWNRDFGTDSVESTDNSLLALEQRVEEACALVERVLREREEREQFGREIERKEREIREQRARKKREREARELEEASRWPQKQEAITGRSQWLCEHYQRHCRVRFPCCSYFYSCHRCHNNSKACKNQEAKACHATHLKCSFCQHEQEIGEDGRKCRSCGAEMSAYFCSICKHFTSVDKNPYHCEKCGICRIHKDKSFHCEVCNVCLDKRLEGKHKCRPDSGHDECCICLEDAFSGCQILPCSHKVHRECAIAMIQNGIRTCPVCRHPLYNQASQ